MLTVGEHIAIVQRAQAIAATGPDDRSSVAIGRKVSEFAIAWHVSAGL